MTKERVKRKKKVECDDKLTSYGVLLVTCPLPQPRSDWPNAIASSELKGNNGRWEGKMKAFLFFIFLFPFN